MEYFEKADFNPGGIKDRYDSRDYMWEEVGGAAILTFDWAKGYDIEKELGTVLKKSNFKLVVKDQNGSFSCGGQAWAYLAEVLEALNTGTYEPRSAKFMYAQTCVPGGGSRGRDNADIYVNQGVATEASLSSYEGGQPPKEAFMQRSQDITPAVRLNARLNKASAYAQVGSDIESVAAAIEANSGAVIGIDGQNNGTWLSEFPLPPKTIQWKHWVYAGKAKKIGNKRYIGILNSLGSKAGDKGWQWLSEDYFKEHVWSVWTHVFAPMPPDGFSHVFLKDMKINETSGEVVALQTALKKEKVFPETVPSSGFYGDITAKAVLSFQFKYQIVSSATDSDNGKIVGPRTRAKLNQLFGN